MLTELNQGNKKPSPIRIFVCGRMDNILLADTYIITAIHGFVKIKLLIWLRRKEKPPVVRSRAGFPRVVYQNALHRMVVCITSHPSELVEFFPPARQCHPDTKRTCASMDAPLTLVVLALPLALTHHAVSLIWNWQVQKFGHENHLPNLPKRAKDSIARLGRCGQQNLIKEWRNERLTLKELRARAGLLQKMLQGELMSRSSPSRIGSSVKRNRPEVQEKARPSLRLHAAGAGRGN